jgi:hypothetical protein
MDYRYRISGNAPLLYPTETWFGILYYSRKESLPIPKCYPYHGDWGEIFSTEILTREDYPIPHKLDMVWLSIVEKRFYSIESDLPVSKIQDIWDKSLPETFSHIVVGMAPYGGVALWVVGESKSELVEWMHADRFQVSFDEFKPNSQFSSLNDYCHYYIDNDSRVKENLEKNGLPPRNLYDNYMKQFTYRYQVLFGQWDEDKKEWSSDEGASQAEASSNTDHPTPEFDYIEEALFDGTHDKLHDGGLMNYHEAGKPKKLVVQWHIKKSEYTAYFWFEDELICNIFNRFYGAHPETKTDFMVWIDAENNKYELALYRYGLKEPQVISESVYQLIVFKNKFECFRSENYNQERGAWIW